MADAGLFYFSVSGGVYSGKNLKAILWDDIMEQECCLKGLDGAFNEA